MKLYDVEVRICINIQIALKKKKQNQQALTTRSASLYSEHLQFIFKLLLSVNSREFMKYLWSI